MFTELSIAFFGEFGYNVFDYDTSKNKEIYVRGRP